MATQARSRSAVIRARGKPLVTEMPRPTDSGVIPYRLTVRQFEQMIGVGVFPDDAHVELLGGLLADQMNKYPPHNSTVDRLSDLLRNLLPRGWICREEKPVVLGRYWCPEPDLSVVRGPRDRYRSRDPGARDLGFVVEVAESSYAQDRGIKWRGYAAARVPAYWIVNLPERAVEVYTEPRGRGATAAYHQAARFGPDGEIPVVVEGREVGRVAVREFRP